MSVQDMLLRLPFLTPETKFLEQNGEKLKSMCIQLQVNFDHPRKCLQIKASLPL